MALTLARVATQKHQPQAIGTLRTVLIDVTFDASYPTGGESLTPEMVGLVGILGGFPVSWTAAHAGYTVRLAGDRVLVYDDEGDEIADTTDLSALVLRLLIVGY